jgi:hypothetical protein
MGDTRALFDHLTSRKEGHWEGVKFIAGEELDDVRMRTLLSLPARMVGWDTSPMDDLFPQTRPPAAIEFLVQRLGEEGVEYYYVNTEGYPYARYAFRFEPRPVGRG